MVGPPEEWSENLNVGSLPDLLTYEDNTPVDREYHKGAIGYSGILLRVNPFSEPQ
jgi:hypothetical protein